CLPPEVPQALPGPLGEQAISKRRGRRAKLLVRGRARQPPARAVADQRHRLLGMTEQRVAQACRQYLAGIVERRRADLLGGPDPLLPVPDADLAVGADPRFLA